MKYYLVLLSVVVTCTCQLAYADSPLAPPEKHTVCSSSGKICATSDPKRNITHISAIGSKKILWSIPSWHRWLFVADDGESVVAGFNGMNLVPVDVTLQEPVLFFYNHGKLVRTVTLADLYVSKSQLRRTVSHFSWVNSIAFNKSNQLMVGLVNGKETIFDSKTGKIIQ